ncbi:MAG: hypothetical protein U1E23_14735 [Reyranellaceae bacterium]
MARYHGKDGKITIGVSGDVNEVSDWTLDLDNQAVDASFMGNASRNAVQGQYGGSIAITCNYDPADSDGQEAMNTALMTAASVTFKLYEQGSGTTKKYWSGTAWVTKMGEKGSVGGKITRDYTLTIEGDAVRSTVP